MKIAQERPPRFAGRPGWAIAAEDLSRRNRIHRCEHQEMKIPDRAVHGQIVTKS
jgi:hypothetical protein